MRARTRAKVNHLYFNKQEISSYVKGYFGYFDELFFLRQRREKGSFFVSADLR
jgi:hypothetical protein